LRNRVNNRIRVNLRIRARELRVIDDKGENIGVLKLDDALALAKEKGLDLVEISPNANPPIAKITNFGKFQYEQNKKQKQSKVNVKVNEIKSIQIKIGTGQHDLEMKAKNASRWLKEGHKIKVELFLAGRAKYLDRNFLKERLQRVLNLITEDYKMSQEIKKIPKGLMTIIEKVK